MISWEEFKKQGELLVKDLEVHDKEGTWVWETPRKYPEEGNSMLRRMPQVLNTERLFQQSTNIEENEEEEGEDDEIETFYEDAEDNAVQKTPVSEDERAASHKIIAEYSVVWSSSYQVPVLYFSLWEEHGTKRSSLTEGISEVVHSFEKHVGFEDNPEVIKMNALLSQGEHPLLGVPAWYLHPCKTGNVMETIVPKEEWFNYLKAWLALYGSFAGLKIDFL